MKFLTEMIARKKETASQVSEIEGPDAMGMEGFETPEHVADDDKFDPTPPEAEDDPDPVLRHPSKEENDAARIAAEEVAEAAIEDEDDGSYDWDVSEIDLDGAEPAMPAPTGRFNELDLDPADAAEASDMIAAVSGAMANPDFEIAPRERLAADPSPSPVHELEAQPEATIEPAPDTELVAANDEIEDEELHIPRDLAEEISSGSSDLDESEPEYPQSMRPDGPGAERPISKPKIWDIEPSQEPEPQADPAPEHPPLQEARVPVSTASSHVADVEPSAENDAEIDAVAAPLRRKGGRVKTRLLGFGADAATVDPIAAAREHTRASETVFPVGWMVVVSGPGRGASFTLTSGASSIGRGEDQAIRLDFGDNTISRDNHAVVAYDDEQKRFFMGHGGKANLVRLNDMPVLSTEPLSDGDHIRIGETRLKFVALCGPDFSWSEDEEADDRHAAAI